MSPSRPTQVMRSSAKARTEAITYTKTRGFRVLEQLRGAGNDHLTWLAAIVAVVIVGLTAVLWQPAFADAQDASAANQRVFLPLVERPADSCDAAPCLLSPADGAAVDTLLPAFAWDAGTSASSTSLLHICPTSQVPCGSCYPSCPFASGPGVHSVVPEENLPARKVWWAIELQYVDSDGKPQRALSPVRSLDVTGELPLLPAPALIGPGGIVTETTVTFQWQPVPGVLDYKLCHWGPKGWPCYTTTRTELTVTFPSYEQGYQWWVEARNDYGFSPHNTLYVHIRPSAAGLARQSAQ